jgi:hypothetical protein
MCFNGLANAGRFMHTQVIEHDHLARHLRWLADVPLGRAVLQ